MWITVFSRATREIRVGTTVGYMVPKVATPATHVPERLCIKVVSKQMPHLRTKKEERKDGVEWRSIYLK